MLSALSDPAEDFVRSVSIQLHRSPMIVLYMQEQMDDLRLLCSRESPSHLRSVLSVDRTFNLSSLFVTVMAYKNRKVVRRTSQEPPIFIGPIMLHGNGKLATYLHFFTSISGALNGAAVASSEFACDGLVIRSDEERALVSAGRIAFPNAKQLYCMMHCKDNVRHHLTAMGVSCELRERVLAKLFGCNGVSEASKNTKVKEILKLVQLS